MSTTHFVVGLLYSGAIVIAGYAALVVALAVAIILIGHCISALVDRDKR